MTLGFVRSAYDWEWKEAEHHYRRALDADSWSSAETCQWYASDYLAPLGRLEEAMSQMQRAVMLDPLSLQVNNSFAFVLIMRREYRRAIQHLQKCLELDPHFYQFHTCLGRAHLQMGEFETALSFFLKGQEFSNRMPYVTGILAHCLAEMGQQEEARRLLDELLRIGERQYIPYTTLALVCSALGELDQCFHWFGRAIEIREGPLSLLKIHPVYDPLRSDARFGRILETIGLS